MIFEQPYVNEALMLILGAVLGWLPNRKKNKVDTKLIEVQVLEKAIQVINKDVVLPLRENQRLLLEDYESLRKTIIILRNAINKMHYCPAASNCPIKHELQKSEGINAKGTKRKPATNRQREPNRPRDDTDDEDTTDDSEVEPYTR
ncbi:hypothetical protein [Dysgonomonas sp. ZJ709]|uniref:hypothetical protein n=1 Tax=Dysgonomonas sp. ZJ709 TaxID=2709797 RepID=UPI0013EDE760|nr:hypothetical protein [Dysgonomonas sp. ZJ709]